MKDLLEEVLNSTTQQGELGFVSFAFVPAEHVVQQDALVVPTFEIASNPTVRLSEIRARRFYIVDRVVTGFSNLLDAFLGSL